MRAPALLTYGWVRSTYAALKNLYDHNVPVYIADTNRIGMCQCSRFPAGKYLYADPYKSPDTFIEDINSLLVRTGARVLIPSHDETVVIAKNLNRLPQDVFVPIPSEELLDLANDKGKMQEYAQQCGVTTARRITYSSIDELEEKVAEDKVTKYVIRLCRGNSAKGVFYSIGKEALTTMTKRLISEFDCSIKNLPVIQEFVEGEGWGVSCLYWKGERVAHFTHRRLREKTLTGGTSTLREHQPNEQLETMAFTLLNSMKWHGLAMVEFKYDPSKQQAWFIEINPRLWGSIHLAIASNIEFPYLLYLCALEGAAAAKQYLNKKERAYPCISRWYLGDLISVADRIQRRKFMEIPKLILPGGANTYDDINLSDPGAFLGELLHYGTGFLKTGSVNPVEKGMIG